MLCKSGQPPPAGSCLAAKAEVHQGVSNMEFSSTPLLANGKKCSLFVLSSRTSWALRGWLVIARRHNQMGGCFDQLTPLSSWLDRGNYGRVVAGDLYF